MPLGRRLLGVRRREQHRRPRHRRRRRPDPPGHDLRRLGRRRRLEEHGRRRDLHAGLAQRLPAGDRRARARLRRHALGRHRRGERLRRRHHLRRRRRLQVDRQRRHLDERRPRQRGHDRPDRGRPGRTRTSSSSPPPAAIYSTGGKRGLYRTIDGGDHWAPILTPDLNAAPYTGVVDVAIDPVNPNRVYATEWDHHRTDVPAALRRHRLRPLRHRQRAGRRRPTNVTWERIDNSHVSGPLPSYDASRHRAQQPTRASAGWASRSRRPTTRAST